MNRSLITKGIKDYTSWKNLNSGVYRGFESKTKLLVGRATYLSVLGLFSYMPIIGGQSVLAISIDMGKVISLFDSINC